MNKMMRDRNDHQQNIFNSQPSSWNSNRGWNSYSGSTEKTVFKDRINLRLYRTLRKEGLSSKEAKETVRLLTGAAPND